MQGKQKQFFPGTGDAIRVLREFNTHAYSRQAAGAIVTCTPPSASLCRGAGIQQYMYNN